MNLVYFQATLLNPADGGKLGIKLRHQRLEAKRRNTPCDEEVISDENEMEKVFQTLKSMVVDNEIEDIKANLRKTLFYRANMLKNIDINLQECFPYFFVSYELVNILFGFELTNV